MSGNSLEERLKSNANAFDGLLSLISAKYYDNEDNKVNNKRKHHDLSSEDEGEGFGEYDNQWKAVKKSKEELKENKRKKFAKDDVIKTGSVKDMMDNMEKQKLVTPAQKLRERIKQKQSQQVQESEESSREDEIDVIFDDNGNPINEEGTSEPEEKKELSDNEVAYEELQQKKENTEKINEEKQERKKKNIELLRSKLQNKISSLKQNRKAVGSNVQGAPKSREELLAQRRKREELIKQRKEEADSDDEDDDNDSSDSESDFDIDEDINAENVMYGSINFNDGSKVTSDLQRIRGKTEKSANAKKGPAKRDYKAQLRILEKKKAKLANKDEMEQIKEIENKGWQKAMLAAEGITVRDDEKLLKKALKKKEQKKRKSAVQWQDRKQQVITTIAERTKRREENLRMRKENKGKKRKHQVKLKKSLKGKTMVKRQVDNPSKKGNKKAGNNKRAGFEGSMKRK